VAAGQAVFFYDTPNVAMLKPIMHHQTGSAAAAAGTIPCTTSPLLHGAPRCTTVPQGM